MNGPRVGEILEIQEGDEGDMIASFRFDDNVNGNKTKRLFTLGLLWSLQAIVSVKSTQKMTAEVAKKYAIPFDCEKIATCCSLDVVSIDAFAPF